MSGRLEGRVAVITGGASGIGRAAAELFASEGGRVLAVDMPGSDLSFADPTIRGFEKDVTDEDAPAAIMAAAQSDFGRLDIVYNNAGISERGDLVDITDAFWDRMLIVNLRAGFRLIQAAVPLLKQSPAGRVISTASVAAERSGVGLGAYSASKAGLVGMMRTFALELGVYGVTANCILPGPIMSKMTRAFLEQPDYAKAWSDRAPLGRIGQPIDVARVALFLASDDAGYMTGQSLIVDGGISSVS
ncbi:MAG TPA: SDR family NAD(P)-dependent oxidoreductase [Caulobacteraceae bacterium]|nr:SDR family NAD(P)-dependent oxidoreductase [Caulobacteraceae bacterium]